MATLEHETNLIRATRLLIEAAREEQFANTPYEIELAMENTAIAGEAFLAAGGTIKDAQSMGVCW